MRDALIVAGRWTGYVVGCVSLWIAETLSPERYY